MWENCTWAVLNSSHSQFNSSQLSSFLSPGGLSPLLSVGVGRAGAGKRGHVRREKSNVGRSGGECADVCECAGIKKKGTGQSMFSDFCRLPSEICVDVIAMHEAHP